MLFCFISFCCCVSFLSLRYRFVGSDGGSWWQLQLNCFEVGGGSGDGEEHEQALRALRLTGVGLPPELGEGTPEPSPPGVRRGTGRGRGFKSGPNPAGMGAKLISASQNDAVESEARAFLQRPPF